MADDLTFDDARDEDELDELADEIAARHFDRRQVLYGAGGAILGLFAGTPLARAGRLIAGGAQNTKQIAFAQPDTSFAGYKFLLQGAKSAGRARGYDILESHANHQLDAQVSEITTWVAQRIGGMIVLPLDNNAMAPLIRRAHQNGVKFLDYSDKALPGVDGWVIFNNLQGAHQVGRYAGRWVNRVLHGRAKVGLLTHEVQKTGRDRIHGAVAALKRVAPKARVVARHEGVLAAECLTVTQSMLQAHPDLNVIFCIADDGALGAEKAFMQRHPSRARQRRMFIAGWDGTVPVFQKILHGSVIRATGALDLVGIGAASIRATANAIEGKKPTQINYPYVLVPQTNRAVVRKFLRKYGA